MRKIAAVMLTVALALSLALSPTRAYAFGGTYVGNCTTKEETAAQYLGYSYYELPSEVRGLLSGAGYSAWQRWESSLWVYGTLEHPSFREGWGTDYEGAELVNVTDAARNDIERAIKAAASSGGTSGGGTGTGGGTSSGTGGGGGTVTMYYGRDAYLTYTADNKTVKSYGTDPRNGFLSEPITVGYGADFANTLSGYQGYKAVWILNGVSDGRQKAGALVGQITSTTSYGEGYRLQLIMVPANCEILANKTTLKRGGEDVELVTELKVVNPNADTVQIVKVTDSSTYSYQPRTQTGIVMPSPDGLVFNSSNVSFGTQGIAHSDAGVAITGAANSNNPMMACSIAGTIGSGGGSGTGGGNTTNNNQVYDNDTTNITNNITNSEETTYNETNNTYITNNDVDVSAITQRLDAINAKLGQVGRDLLAVEQWLDEDWSAALDTMRGWWNRLFSWLNVIDSDIRALQTDTGGGGGSGDLSGIESQLEDVKGKLDALLVAATIDAAASVAQAIMELINGLLSKFGDALGVLKDAMGELSSVFPFSLPWDLAAIAALFAADPVTPVFDLAVPDFGQIHSATNIHVDLHDWDDVAAVVRSGELVLFATDLILRTREMMGAGSDDVC